MLSPLSSKCTAKIVNLQCGFIGVLIENKRENKQSGFPQATAQAVCSRDSEGMMQQSLLIGKAVNRCRRGCASKFPYGSQGNTSPHHTLQHCLCDLLKKKSQQSIALVLSNHFYSSTKIFTHIICNKMLFVFSILIRQTHEGMALIMSNRSRVSCDFSVVVSKIWRTKLFQPIKSKNPGEV